VGDSPGQQLIDPLQHRPCEARQSSHAPRVLRAHVIKVEPVLFPTPGFYPAAVAKIHAAPYVGQDLAFSETGGAYQAVPKVKVQFSNLNVSDIKLDVGQFHLCRERRPEE
jgi:hypothetical protein